MLQAGRVARRAGAQPPSVAAHALPSPCAQQHYCIAIGIKDSSGLLDRFGLPHFSQPQIVQPQSAGLGGGGGMRPPPPRFFA